MRRKRAVTLWVICLLGIGVFAGIKLWEQWRIYRVPVSHTERVMGVAVVSDTEFLQGKERLTAPENPGVAFEQVELPYDSAGERLYLPQNTEIHKWIGELSAARQGYFLCTKQDSYWQDKQTAIRDNHGFTLWLVGEDCYYELELVISGMPVICMNTRRIVEQEEVDPEIDPDKRYYDSETLHYGIITVFDPGVEDGVYRIHQSHVCYHEKGASTRNFEKKGYSLSLQDYQGKNIDTPLLGMRSDNSWKLNALNTDVNKIREITASQIWTDFDGADTAVSEPGPKMEYTELILDGDYRGLYCLVEPVDEKKLGLDKNDVLYKVIDWDAPAREDIQVSVDRGWKIQYPVRIRYPKVITDYAAAWYPMMDYLGIYYENPELDYERALSRVNVSNLCDIFLFTMVTSASDNSFKNTYFAAEVSPAGAYVMRQIPWDLDYTFGNRYAYNVLNNVWFDEDYTVIYAETTLPRLKLDNPEEIGLCFLERWNTYREGFLSTENILQCLQNNRHYIMETGAAQREAERWPEAGVDMDIEYLLNFQKKRMDWLDGFLKAWALSEGVN